MNKSELIDAVAANTGETKATVQNVIDAMTNVATVELAKGGEVVLHGLGKLTVKAKPARKGRNPKTGEEMELPAKNAPHFSVSKTLKDAVNA